MAVFKCKMCGGTIEVAENQTTVTCDYCGTNQTLPKLGDERKANLYDRANHFRRNNEFDKAEDIYEQILTEDNTDAESYWSLVLCKYGIEYVEDPTTKKRVPTVNRAQFTSVFNDDNYKSALKYADIYQKAIYEAEASTINKIQKGILEISQREEPFDIFICYKETDHNGRRTQDSVLANELYHELVKENYKVFFSRITLEDKLGIAYEPYIFAALNSAKVMVVLGTRPEHFNAVWVKNEWSRYLSLVKASDGKKILIPAYRDMNPYDLPEEFSHLQAQDMSKLGFMQDLIRGIKKLIPAKTPVITKEAVTAESSINVSPLLKRAFMFLEDGEFERADEFCEQVLNQDPEKAEAYLVKLMIDLRANKKEYLKNAAQPFNTNSNFQKAMRFGDEALKQELSSCIEYINEQNEIQRLGKIYQSAIAKLNYAESHDFSALTLRKAAYEEAIKIFKTIIDFKDSAEKIKFCENSIKEIGEQIKQNEIDRKNKIYSSACKDQEADKLLTVQNAIKEFSQISGWQDSDERLKDCKLRLEKLKAESERLAKAIQTDKIYIKAEQLRNEASIRSLNNAIKYYESILHYKDSEDKIIYCKRYIEEITLKNKKRAKRNWAIAISSTSVICVIIVFIIILNTVIIPNRKYNAAISLMNSGKYIEAYEAFTDIHDYRESCEKAKECVSQLSKVYLDQGNVKGLIEQFDEISLLHITIPTDYEEKYYSAICKEYINIDEKEEYWINIRSNLKEAIKYLKYISTYKDAANIIELYEFLNYTEQHLKLTEHSDIEEWFQNDICKQILTSDALMEYFLVGYWECTENSTVNLKFFVKDNGISVTYNLPFPNVERVYFDINNKEMIFEDSNSNFVAKAYKFDIISFDEMNVYCYADGKTYNMKR